MLKYIHNLDGKFRTRYRPLTSTMYKDWDVKNETGQKFALVKKYVSSNLD